jgi:hypothetical protein
MPRDAAYYQFGSIPGSRRVIRTPKTVSGIELAQEPSVRARHSRPRRGRRRSPAARTDPAHSRYRSTVVQLVPGQLALTRASTRSRSRSREERLRSPDPRRDESLTLLAHPSLPELDVRPRIGILEQPRRLPLAARRAIYARRSGYLDVIPPRSIPRIRSARSSRTSCASVRRRRPR